jgi:hypothetical protein
VFHIDLYGYGQVAGMDDLVVQMYYFEVGCTSIQRAASWLTGTGPPCFF